MKVGDWFDKLDAPEASDADAPEGDALPEPEGPRGGLAGSLPPLVGDGLDAALDVMRRRRSGDERPIPLPWASVGKALSGGLWPGLHVLVGGTGTGKTAFAVEVAVNAACPRPDSGHDPVPVLYVALELGPVDMVARCLAVPALAKRPWSDLYLGRIDPDELNEGYLDRLRKAPLYLEVGPPHGWAYDALHDRVSALRRQYPTGPLLVVVDFLQLVASPAGRREDLRERIAGAAYACRAAARDHGAAVLALSSASRENAAKLGVPRADAESRAALHDAYLLVGMGKESGDVEFSADSVIVLRKLEHVQATETTKGGTVVDVVIAKQRAGRSGFADPPLLFTGSWFEQCLDDRRKVVERAKKSAKTTEEKQKNSDRPGKAPAPEMDPSAAEVEL